MPRIAGVNIPEDKQIRIALTYVFGIGRSSSEEILERTNIDPVTEAKDLTPEEIGRLKEVIEKDYQVEGEVRRKRMMNIKRLKDIGSWRGTRHKKGLPVRGQRTRTNSRTVRGNVRKTVGSGRKAPPSPK
ncbi:MAG: 30S ribosomal protein S13 [Candidatus Nealsonbacteria bacterium]|nr:30S ribosomal protein S13 [Candidatus Nealsonbacteria bacterium]